MIHPNVIIYQEKAYGQKESGGLPVTKIPLEDYPDSDHGKIDHIRSQFKPNEIDQVTQSPFAEDIQQMVKLLGSFCKKNSINEIVKIVTEIHGTLSGKDAPRIKNWIRLMTAMHPDVDNRIKQLGYWKKPYSEIIGTNTVIYSAGPGEVDITFWAKKPMFEDNIIEWFLGPWKSPSYIRESVREKLDSGVVAYIQNSNHRTTVDMRRNLIQESVWTTQRITGAEIRQRRPVKPVVPEINHGLSLNNDWYHQTYRIMDNCKVKELSKNDAIAWLDSGGYLVHLLVNHLEPLINANSALQHKISQFDHGVEETFPTRFSAHGDEAKQNYVDNTGRNIFNNASDVNDDVIKPEIIEGE